MTVRRDHVNLLYITADKKSPYILVKNLSTLMLRQYNNDNNKIYFCQYCLHGCTNEEVLKNDMERCKLHEPQRIKLPEAGDRRDLTKSSLQKRNTETRISHHHQNPSPLDNNITYPVGAASTSNAVMDNTLNHSK